MEIYKFNKERLAFEKTNEVLKWRIISFILFLAVGFLLISAQKVKTVVELVPIKTEPIKESNYVKDLYKSIGFTLTNSEYKRFEYLALKYKDKLEENHIPATLVWWIAFRESNFKLDAKNPNSSAFGLFGFTNGTFNSMCKLGGIKNNKNSEETQVEAMIEYLNYLYSRHNSWNASIQEYQGKKSLYPISFLLK